MPYKFKKYLKDNSQRTRDRALTASSYKKAFERKNGSPLSDEKTNTELATYGDAILKLAFCKILFDAGVSNITVEKQKYESDEAFVKIIARHYKLLEYIKFDEDDSNIPQNYDYLTKPNGKSPHKYIATVVEALVAAYYLDNSKNFSLVLEVAREWKRLIDESKSTEMIL